MTLTEFLLARFAEDVEDACKMAGLHPDGTEDWKEDADGYAVSNRMTRVGRRVLLDCEAKRRIVGLADFADEPGAWPVYLAALRALALPYADHPDYREGWRP